MRACSCLCVYVSSEMCEIDATACSTSLTEESSGMEMDHMVTVTMVPDALALKKGIGWVWLRTDLPPQGWDGLHCTIFSLFVDCVVHCLLIVYLSVDLFARSSCLFLIALPVVFTLFLFFLSLFVLVLVHCCLFGYFPLWAVFNHFYSKNWTHSACELHY